MNGSKTFFQRSAIDGAVFSSGPVPKCLVLRYFREDTVDWELFLQVPGILTWQAALTQKQYVRLTSVVFELTY